jgi:hypothetical protein
VNPFAQDASYLRIIVRNFDVRGKQFQLLGFALLVEHLHAFQPPCLRGSIQLPQVAQRPLARAVHRSHRLHQRPVGVILTVLVALMRPQRHLAPSLSSDIVSFKRVGLHYIAFSEPAIAKTRLVSLVSSKIAESSSAVTNFG